MAGTGTARQARRGLARRGWEELGPVRRGKARQARQGVAGRGEIRHSEAGIAPNTEMQGRLGKARSDLAWHGKARRGNAGNQR